MITENKHKQLNRAVTEQNTRVPVYKALLGNETQVGTITHLNCSGNKDEDLKTTIQHRRKPVKRENYRHLKINMGHDCLISLCSNVCMKPNFLFCWILLFSTSWFLLAVMAFSLSHLQSLYFLFCWPFILIICGDKVQIKAKFTEKRKPVLKVRLFLFFFCAHLRSVWW